MRKNCCDIIFVIFLYQRVSEKNRMSKTYNPPPIPKLPMPPPQQLPQEEVRRPNGSIYHGGLQEGKFEGRGVLIYPNKQRYQGQFHNDMKHGKGKYYYLKGQLYIGDWFENKKHGKGLYLYENGKRYQGDFKNNLKHGWGRIDEDDGSYYEGYFAENNKDQTGEYYDAQEDKKYLMIYENGKQVSCREIIEIPDVKQINNNLPPLPEFLRNPSKKTKDNVDECRQILSEDLLIDDQPQKKQSQLKNFASQCEPIIKSLRNLNFQKNRQENSSKQEIILTNYFSKNLIDKRINEWTKNEVCEWLNQIGFGDCLQQFRENKIEGDSLLTLTNSNLKELNVAALGDRKILQREIQFLRLIFKRQCLGDPISKFYHRDVTLKLVRELSKKKTQIVQGRQEKYEISESDSSSSSSEEKEKQRQTSRHKQKKPQSKKTMQWKVSNYMDKLGIKQTFLIPKDQIEIIKPIGKGGYGQVYLGRWLGQDVAVKKYLKKQGFRNRHVGHFIEEVQVINKLLHPSIVLYMGMCIYDNEYGMVTQFLSGGSLFDYLHKRREKLTEERIFYICKDVALGMSYLHGKNVLHCDLKSSNVLIDENWNVKLCDFGLSRINNTKKNKKNNIRVGTPHWMAPEILRGQKYQCQSDVYSFGIILWEMLTGQIPYKDLSTAEIVKLVGNDETHHIPIPKYLNKLFLGIFIACTHRDMSARPTFKQIVEELEKAENEYGGGTEQYM